MSKLTRAKAAKIKGVATSTLRRWEAEGKLIPSPQANGHRRYDLAQLLGRLVLNHKDRLWRFGWELIFSLCEVLGTEVVIINRTKDASYEEDLAKDV